MDLLPETHAGDTINDCYHDFDYYDFYGNSTDGLPEFETTHHTATALLIVPAVVNTAILLTAIPKTVRACSVCWYMYHVTLVSVIQTVISAVLQNYQTSMIRGLCLLLIFAELSLTPINMYTIILMNIEVFRTLASNISSAIGSIPRYVISTVAICIVSMIFAATVIFFSDEPGTVSSACVIYSHTTHKVILVITRVVPFVIMFVCMCIGSGFYIRARRNSERYQNEAADRENRNLKTEQFVFFILWNFIYVLTTCLMVAIGETQHHSDAYIVIFACRIVHHFTPCLSLIFRSVRLVIKTTVQAVVNFMLGRTNVSASRVSNIVALDPIQT